MAAKNPPARSFEDLIVWRKAHEFVLSVYRLTKKFPRTEMYGLISQLRRSAVSIPANIVEGFRRKGRPDKARLFNVAEASADESRYYLILARDMGYGDWSEEMDLLEEVSKLLRAYARSVLNANPPNF